MVSHFHDIMMNNKGTFDQNINSQIQIIVGYCYLDNNFNNDLLFNILDNLNAQIEEDQMFSNINLFKMCYLIEGLNEERRERA